MSNDKIQAVGVNIAEKATMIWNVADMLRSPFKPHEYGLVILPTLLSDEKGYFDRECPNENCQHTFKICMEDWKEKVSDEERYVVACWKAPSATLFLHSRSLLPATMLS